jgi:hypothetical protein
VSFAILHTGTRDTGVWTQKCWEEAQSQTLRRSSYSGADRPQIFMTSSMKSQVLKFVSERQIEV